MTLKEWKARMQVGVTIRCIWRNYWEKRPSEKPESGYQDMTVVETQTNGLWFTRPDDTRRSWMTMPKASEIIHTHTGFELFHAGVHVATYIYLTLDVTNPAWTEYDHAAMDLARKGLTGAIGDPLPLNITPLAVSLINADPDAFQKRVKESAYALSMERA